MSEGGNAECTGDSGVEPGDEEAETCNTLNDDENHNNTLRRFAPPGVNSQAGADMTVSSPSRSGRSHVLVVMQNTDH
jgi:hypothetical protein